MTTQQTSSSVKGLIFDCDGTILDSMPAWHSMEEELARRAGLELTPALQDELNANTLDQTVAFFHEKGLGETYEDLYKECLSLLTRFYVTVKTKPGIVNFLREAARHGVPMVIASSSPSVILETGLGATGLTPFFKKIISASDMGTSKRNPIVINTACEILDAPRECIWGVEDSVYSLEIFRNEGFKTIGIYDSDIAGTYENLVECSDIAVHSFDEIDLEAFFESK